MEKSTIRYRIKQKDGLIWLRALIEHPMETGLRKHEETGLTIPAHYIKHLVVEVNGETVFSADWSTSISEDPLLFIKFVGSEGDTVRPNWGDSMGQSDFIETTVGER